MSFYRNNERGILRRACVLSREGGSDFLESRRVVAARPASDFDGGVILRNSLIDAPILLIEMIDTAFVGAALRFCGGKTNSRVTINKLSPGRMYARSGREMQG